MNQAFAPGRASRSFFKGLFTPGWEGGISYERGGDARRLGEGCKFRILVSLRVVARKELLYIFISLCLKMVSFRRQKRLVSFRGLIQNFRRASPFLLYETRPHFPRAIYMVQGHLTVRFAGKLGLECDEKLEFSLAKCHLKFSKHRIVFYFVFWRQAKSSL